MYQIYDTDNTVNAKAKKEYSRAYDRYQEKLYAVPLEERTLAFRKQIFQPVETAAAKARDTIMPPLITCDAMLQAYHKLLVRTLKGVERSKRSANPYVFFSRCPTRLQSSGMISRSA
jgi:hypothetical protein